MNSLAVSVVPDTDPETGEAKLRVVVKIDGRSLLDFSYFNLAADLVALQRSVEKPGEHFIVTCSCGDPGCAGIRRGIQVTHQGDRVRWVYKTLVPDPKTQPELLKKTPSRRPEWVVRGVELPTETYIFDREAYAAAIKQGVKRGVQLLKQYGQQKVTVVPLHNRALLERQTISG